MSSPLAASVGSLRIKEPDGLSAFDSSESLSELANDAASTGRRDRSASFEKSSDPALGLGRTDSRRSVSKHEQQHSHSNDSAGDLSAANSFVGRDTSDSNRSRNSSRELSRDHSVAGFSPANSMHRYARDTSSSSLAAHGGAHERVHEQGVSPNLDFSPEHSHSAEASRELKHSHDPGSSHSIESSHAREPSEGVSHEPELPHSVEHSQGSSHALSSAHNVSHSPEPAHGSEYSPESPEPGYPAEQETSRVLRPSRETGTVHTSSSKGSLGRTELSTVQKSRVRSSGSPGLDSGSLSHNTLGSKILHSEEDSPLDEVDRLLSGTKPRLASPASHAGRPARFRSPLKAGMLSFDTRPAADDEIMNSESRDEYWANPNEPGDGTLGGVRRNQGRARKLETENMELRLKLQQYREMNASEQEMSRVKYQVSRLERRIDELEEALERKNQTIRDLVEERDANIQSAHSEQTKELYQTIEELQLAISTLEQESLDSDKRVTTALSQAHKEFPTILPENADVPDLVNALRLSIEENDKLRSLAATASSLRSQQDSMRSLLAKLGHPGDPLTSVQEVVQELDQTSRDAAVIRESMGRENWNLSREIESLREAYLLKSREASDANARLKARSENDTATIRDLEGKLEDLEHVLNESRSTSYAIVRRFFSELFDVLGADFQESVEQELEHIMARARKEGLSKIPLLTDLLVSHARRLAETVAAASSKSKDDQKIWALEREVQSLEQIIGLKWEKAGADAVLRAQVKDLRNQLKLEQEKRKSEWMEYERSVQKARATNI